MIRLSQPYDLETVLNLHLFRAYFAKRKFNSLNTRCICDIRNLP